MSIETIPFSEIIKLDEKDIYTIIDTYIEELSKRNKDYTGTINFKLFNSDYKYYTESESLKVRIGSNELEINKGLEGPVVSEQLNLNNLNISKSDVITLLTEYQKEKKIACKVFQKLRKKFLPKRKRKGLYKKKRY